MKTKFSHEVYTKDLLKMKEGCEAQKLTYINNNEFDLAFEDECAKEALSEVFARTACFKTEKKIIGALNLILREYRNLLKIKKQNADALGCLRYVNKIREVEDNVLNELLAGSFDSE